MSDSAGGTSVASAEGASFLVRSELMQNYTTAKAFGDSPNLASALDAEGDVQLFSVGTSGEVFNVFPSARAENGWGIRPLHAPVAVEHLAVGTELGGTVVLLVCGSDSHIYWKSDEKWSAWIDLGQPFGDPTMTVQALRVGYDRHGEVIFQAIANQGYSQNQIVVRIYPRQADNPWDYVSTYIQGEIYDCAPGSGAFGDGAFVSSADNLRQNTNVSFYQDHQILGRTVYDEAINEMVALAGVRDGGGTTQLFMMSEQGEAFFVEELAERPDNLTPFATNYLGQPVTFACIRASRLVSGADVDGGESPLQFFGIATDGTLYSCGQQLPVPALPPVDLPEAPEAAAAEDGDPPALSWSPLIALGDGLRATADSLALCRDSQGYTRCFAVTTEGVLLQFWQDASTDWKAEPVTVAYEGELVDFPTYSTEVTVLDADGNPVPSQVLRISAADALEIDVNGVPASVGPQRSVTCTTNTAGRVTVTTPTGTIGVPAFQVAASFLSDGVLTIAPDRYVQSPEYLYPATAAELQTTLSTATYTDENGNQQPLIDTATYGEYLPDASQAIWQSMSLGVPETGDEAAAVRFVSPRGDRRGVQVMAPGSFGDRIDVAKVAPQFWRVEFLEKGKGVRFHVLRDEAHYREVVAELAAGVEPARDSFSIHLPKPDWGTLWHSVRTDAAELKNIAVATISTIESETVSVVRRIETTIQTAVENALQGLVSYVVDTVRQVFDMAQGVLQALAADFEKLYRWIGSLFDWSSIVTAHTAIANILNTFVHTQLPATLNELEQKVDGFFEQFTTQGVDTGSLGSQTLGDGYSSATEQAGQAPGPSSNWMQNQMLNSGGGNPASTPATSAPPDASPLETFEQQAFAELGGLYDTLVAQLNAALAQGKSATDLSPNQILELAGTMVANDLLAAAQTVSDLAFDFAEFVVATVGQVAGTPWHIPVISKLYKQKLGAEMSVLDLTALALALPTTVFAKAAGIDLATLTAVAANVELLNRHLTPAQLLGREPVDEATLARLRADGFDSTDVTAASQVLGFIYGSGLLIYSPFACLLVLDKIKNKWVKIVPVFLSLVVLAFSFPLWPGLPTASGITVGCWAIGFLLWFTCNALPSVPDFLPPKPLSPQNQPLLPNNLPATTPVMDLVSGLFGLVGGGFLLGGYVIQAVVEAASDDYLPDATTAEKAGDITFKLVQNCLGVLPTVLLPLNWVPLKPYGKPALAGLTVVGVAGAGVCSLVRVGANILENQVNHVI